MGHCGKRRRCVRFLWRGWSALLFPVLCCMVVKALPVQGKRVTGHRMHPVHSSFFWRGANKKPRSTAYRVSCNRVRFVFSRYLRPRHAGSPTSPSASTSSPATPTATQCCPATGIRFFQQLSYAIANTHCVLLADHWPSGAHLHY